MSDRVASMLAESARCAREGRMLIDRSIALRKAALDALPTGAVLMFTLDFPSLADFKATKQVDGSWLTPEGPATDEWIEECWMRGTLAPPETGV